MNVGDMPMGSGLALVALSIGVLLAAPALAAALARVPRLAPFLDSFILVSVGGIVGLHVVPQSAERAGAWAVGAAAVGLVLPVALHRLDDALTSSGGRRARDLLLFTAFLLGSFIHALFDGTALAGAAMNPSLALGVILHRLPVGLALWLIVRPAVGTGRTALVLGALATGTLAGALAGDEALAGSSAWTLAIVQAFVGGSILHIVAESAPFSPGHTHAPPHPRDTDVVGRWAALAGTALAVALLFGLASVEGHDAPPTGASAALDAPTAFLALATSVAPAMVLSFLLVGVLTALYPAAPQLQGRGVRVLDATLGMAAGLPHPLCSCTVAPLYESLLARGASPASARAFLVAAPELGVPAVFSSLRLFGLPFTAARVLGAAALATLVGMSASARRGVTRADSRAPLATRMAHGLRHGVVDAVDHVGPWLLLGLGAAALLEPMLEEHAGADVPVILQTVGLALLALPLYLCAAGTTVLAALLVHKGLAVGAALTLLLVGPATSLPTLQLLRRRHGSSAAVAFAVLVVGGAVVVGLVAQTLLDGGATEFAQLHEAAHASPSLLETASVVVTAALLLASLFRQGIRGFLLQIMSPQHSHVRDHAHGPGCDHDHGPAMAPDAPLAPSDRHRGLRGPLRRATSPHAPRVVLPFDPRAPSDTVSQDGKDNEP